MHPALRVALLLAIISASFASCGKGQPPAAAATPASTPAMTLTHKLAGTRWTAPGGGYFSFAADGTIVSSSNNELATWTALDATWVIRKTSSGWIDVLIFKDDLSDFTLVPKDFVKEQSTSFHGTRAAN